ncbi:FadR/GntR family transcriptional regulator [Kitasatospora kifunensis]|uniref:DNA-binding FadR family transcriptional regulator n=1 Tax=Kitasatospora kifunensis TaxID=58351 RepID=A0A7W7VZW3_KITKI|nr:FCD domain-containing protein [Kitasatospora kifunensis]MBB4928154.1 DNA-binding FadR family transcriptional regulator [Kitasatospora kifunensis]
MGEASQSFWHRFPAQGFPAPANYTAFNHTLWSFGRYIASELNQGQVLTISQITRQFDVSTSVAREVCRAMQSRDMLSTLSGVGSTVAHWGDWNLWDPFVMHLRSDGPQRGAQFHELLVLRDAIDAQAAAAPRTEAEVADLRLAESEVMLARRRDRREEVAAADHFFHRLLRETCGNRLLQQLSERIEGTLTLYDPEIICSALADRKPRSCHGALVNQLR